MARKEKYLEWQKGIRWSFVSSGYIAVAYDDKFENRY